METEVHAINPNNNKYLYAIMNWGYQAYLDDNGEPYPDIELPRSPIIAWIIVEGNGGFGSIPVLATDQRIDDDEVQVLWNESTAAWSIYFGSGTGEETLLAAVIAEAQESRKRVLKRIADGEIEKPKTGKVSPIRRPEQDIMSAKSF